MSSSAALPDPTPPSRVLRWLFRIPAAAYGAGLGWFFGRRLVLIEHVGRRTGTPHRVVVEVVEHDDVTGTLTVASGFGPNADWYRNLLARPRTHVVLGRRRIPVRAEQVPTATGEQIMTRYARRHRHAARRIVRMLGYRISGTDAEFAEIGRAIPFLLLVPEPTGRSAS